MKKHRNLFEYSHSKLRRGRRLYGRLCSKSINKHANNANVLAIRAQARGLYSANTEFRSIVFSLCRHAYNHSPEFDCVGGFGWYAWIDKNGDVWNRKAVKKHGKLLVRC